MPGIPLIKYASVLLCPQINLVSDSSLPSGYSPSPWSVLPLSASSSVPSLSQPFLPLGCVLQTFWIAALPIGITFPCLCSLEFQLSFYTPQTCLWQTPIIHLFYSSIAFWETSPILTLCLNLPIDDYLSGVPIVQTPHCFAHVCWLVTLPLLHSNLLQGRGQGLFISVPIKHSIDFSLNKWLTNELINLCM